MAGVNAQIATSEEWNRVRVGPFGSRDAATAAQDKAKSVAKLRSDWNVIQNLKVRLKITALFFNNFHLPKKRKINKMNV